MRLTRCLLRYRGCCNSFALNLECFLQINKCRRPISNYHLKGEYSYLYISLFLAYLIHDLKRPEIRRNNFSLCWPSPSPQSCASLYFTRHRYQFSQNSRRLHLLESQDIVPDLPKKLSNIVSELQVVQLGFGERLEASLGDEFVLFVADCWNYIISPLL